MFDASKTRVNPGAAACSGIIDITLLSVVSA